jgi:hypothetical protein
MGIDLLAPFRLLLILVLFIVVFGPAMKLIEYAFRRKGRTLDAGDPKGDSTFRWVFLGGIALTFFVAIIGRSFGLWGEQ